MNDFIELLVGTFSNKTQAQSHPTRFAHIWVNHRKISENRIYGEQAYNYLKDRPYRQFVIEVVEDGEYLRLKNYELANLKHFVGCSNLDEITEDLLTYREGCDIMMKQVGPKTYTGGTSTCECWVNWNNVKTYVQNKVTLSATQYQVEDKGLDATTHHKVWGSNYGAFEFKRQ